MYIQAEAEYKDEFWELMQSKKTHIYMGLERGMEECLGPIVEKNGVQWAEFAKAMRKMTLKLNAVTLKCRAPEVNIVLGTRALGCTHAARFSSPGSMLIFEWIWRCQSPSGAQDARVRSRYA